LSSSTLTGTYWDYQRIKQWYNNHTRSGGTSETRAKVLDLRGKKSKKLQPTQAYSQLYYETHLKSTIADQWEKHVARHPDDAQKTGPPLNFRNKVIKAMYSQESAEVKAEVERRREEGFSDEELEGEVDEEGLSNDERKRRAKAVSYQK
jgi:hypothetical protein